MRVRRAREPTSAVRCAYCHESAGTLAAWTCPGCETVLHEDCRQLSRSCTTLGCHTRTRPASLATATREPGALVHSVAYLGVWAGFTAFVALGGTVVLAGGYLLSLSLLGPS